MLHRSPPRLKPEPFSIRLIVVITFAIHVEPVYRGRANFPVQRLLWS